MKKQTFVLTLLSISLGLSGCGVMFGGSRYTGTIKVKDHPNAEIYVDGMKLGKGEATSLFPRNRPLIVEVRENGFEKKQITFDKSFRTGNFILSVLTWGIVGIGVDLGTGAAYKPAHNTNPNIQKIDTKKFNFIFNYSDN